MKIKAISIGDLFYQKFLNSSHEFTLQIHSVFSNVINLQWEASLYTIGKGQITNGAQTLLIPPSVADFRTWGLKIGDTVRGDFTGLNLSVKIQIEIHEADVWRSIWDLPADIAKCLPNILWFRRFVIRAGNHAGLGEVIKIWPDFTSTNYLHGNYQKIIFKKAVSALEKIRQGLLSDRRLFKSGVQGLIGLGSGLTPAGDDFLVGLLLTYHFLEYLEFFLEFNDEFITDLGLDSQEFMKEIQDKTNLLSSTAVILAIRGRPFQLIVDILQNIFAQQKAKTISSALRLINQGSTSGTDTLAGLIIGYELFLELRLRRRIDGQKNHHSTK